MDAEQNIILNLLISNSMKVICIDAEIRDPRDYGLTEGAIYTASHCEQLPQSYYIMEVPFSKLGNLCVYKKDRFIPLSNIDETELATIREQDKVYH
jgi:hypothetical protein